MHDSKVQSVQDAGPGSPWISGTGGLTSRVCVVAEAARDLQLRDGGPDGTVAKRRRGVRQMGTGTGGKKMRVLASEK